jgi:hypothetical protein
MAFYLKKQAKNSFNSIKYTKKANSNYNTTPHKPIGPFPYDFQNAFLV